jgi:hemolysin III
MQLQHHNEPGSALTHLIGAATSVAALVLMVVFGAINGGASHVVGASIFGASLILLYLSSTIFHAIAKNHPRKKFWQNMDHSMIFVLIAGTYTPMTLNFPHAGWGWSLFGAVWGLAVLGIVLELTMRKAHMITIPLYLIMGWMIAIPWRHLEQYLGSDGLFWLFIGGVSYTIGVIFYMLDSKVTRTKWFGMHEIFHIFVLGGSFAHFWLVLNFLY